MSIVLAVQGELHGEPASLAEDVLGLAALWLTELWPPSTAGLASLWHRVVFPQRPAASSATSIIAAFGKMVDAAGEMVGGFPLVFGFTRRAGYSQCGMRNATAISGRFPARQGGAVSVGRRVYLYCGCTVLYCTVLAALYWYCGCTVLYWLVGWVASTPSTVQPV